MKTKSILFTIFLAINLIGNSQVFMQVDRIQAGVDSSTFVIKILNQPAGSSAFSNSYSPTDDNQKYIINNDTSKLINETDGMYDFYLYDSKKLDINSEVLANAIFIDSIVYRKWHIANFPHDTILNNTCLSNINYQIIQYTKPSNKLSNDGSITFKYNTAQNNSKLMYHLLDSSNSDYFFDSIDPFTFKANNLTNTYITISNLNLCFNSSLAECSFSGIIGNLNNIITNNNLLVNTYETDSYQNCNGTIKLRPLNAIGNITYQWSNDSTVIGSTQQNLCPGVYSILATDESLNSSYLQVYITDGNYNYTDTSAFYLNPQDTVAFNFMNCQIDYNLPIDSLHYQETFVNQKNDTAKYKFDLTLFQGKHTFVLSDTIFIVNDSSVFLNCVVYCQQMKSTIFSGKRISLVRKSKSASLQEIKSEPITVSISPNPTENNITINGLKYNGNLFDITGQKVMKINSKTTSLSHLKNGVYLLKLDNNSKIYKIIKN